MSVSQHARPGQHRLGKVLFSVMAATFLAIGFCVFLFAEQLGLSGDEATLIASAFLIAGLGDVVVLLAWKRVFGNAA